MSPNVLWVPGETKPKIWISGVPQPTGGIADIPGIFSSDMTSRV